MGEILSRAEVDAILSSIEPPRSPGRTAANVDAFDIDAWERHDVTQPTALHGRALKIVQALHSGICERWTNGLKTLLQADVDVRPVGACQSTVTEFLTSLQSPHVTCQISHTATAAESLLIWGDHLAQLLIARLLGGAGDVPEDLRVHLMTNIELRLLGRLNEAVLRELAGLLNDSLSVAAVMQQVSEVPARIAVFACVWFSFEVSACGSTGLIHLGIPGASLGLAASEAASQDTSPISPDKIPTGIKQVTVHLSANLASLKIRADDLAGLQVGDIVMTDLTPKDGVALRLGDQFFCHAAIGTHLGRKALRLIEPPTRE